MKSPINYGSSVLKNENISKNFAEVYPFLPMYFNAFELEEGEVAKYPVDSIVESISQLFGNKPDAENVLLTLLNLSCEVRNNDIDINLLIPMVHTISVLPYFTEKIKKLETTVENLQFALANK